MRPDLDEFLTGDFPALYRERHGDSSETRMADGFPGDGWEPLIRRMSEKLEPFCIGTDLRCAQIKEKFGLLRIYLESSGSIPDEVSAAIADAVAESARTCERCGAPGEPLCPPCRERETARQAERRRRWREGP